jgi:hypothetical protein
MHELFADLATGGGNAILPSIARHEKSEQVSGDAAVWTGMVKLSSFILTMIAIACAGGDDSGGECVPGDASRIGYYCSDDGEWELQQSGVTILTARDQSICPDLAPGSYVLKRTLKSGGADCPEFADEVVVVNSDGSVSGIANPLVMKAMDSCFDQTTIDGCTTTLRRTCTISDCSLQLLLTMDAQTWSGAQSVIGHCPDGSSLSCTHDAWYESR